MEGDYLLVCKSQAGEEIVPFHAATPEEAVNQGRRLVFQRQKDLVESHPFAPNVVRAVLYRGFCDFDGGEFIVLEIPH